MENPFNQAPFEFWSNPPIDTLSFCLTRALSTLIFKAPSFGGCPTDIDVLWTSSSTSSDAISTSSLDLSGFEQSTMNHHLNISKVFTKNTFIAIIQKAQTSDTKNSAPCQVLKAIHTIPKIDNDPIM